MTKNEQAYRDNLELIMKAYPEKMVLTVTEVSRYTGKDRKWCRKYLGVGGKSGTSITGLARALSRVTTPDEVTP